MGRKPSVPRPLMAEGVQRVSVDGDLLWRLRVVNTLGQQLERQFAGSYEAAVVALEELRDGAQVGGVKKASDESLTLMRASELWLDDHKWKVRPSKRQDGIKRKPSGLSTHASSLQWLMTEIPASTQVKRITGRVLEAAISDIRRRDGGLVAPTTKASIASTVRLMFRWLNDMGYLTANPAVSLPSSWGQAVRVREAIPTTVEVEAIASVLDDAHAKILFGDAYRVLALTGLRYSELVGLRRHNVHVDVKNPRIVVRESIVSSGGQKMTYDSTKTVAGERVIPVLKQAVDPLRRLLAHTDSDDGPLSEFLFPGVRGGSMSVAMWNRALAKAREDSPDVTVYSAHYLRHYYCSILIAHGLQDSEVMRLAGHSSITVTRGTYGHLIEMDQTELAAALSATVATLYAANEGD